jgi:hypothetical protein
MSVAAISAIFSRDTDPSQQQSGLRLDLRGLQKALSSGNLEAAQRAFSRFQQDLQAIRPQQSGVRPSAEVNPGATAREDLEALQKALNSGDLPAAERAFLRLQQNKQAIAAVGQQKNPLTGTAARTLKAMPQTNKESSQSSLNGETKLSTSEGVDVFA